MANATPLPRSTPETQGISSSAIIDFLTTAEKNIRSLHSFMLLRHGKVVAEGWWYPWRATTPHMLFSLTKSFTSSAVGFAVNDGLLQVDDSVLDFFPEVLPKKISSNLAEMKVHHLLSMSTGHDQDTTERMITHQDPVKKFLSLPVEHAPGTHFVYNSGASFVLSAILQKLTGQPLLEYLTPRLFVPLGIEGATWESHPNGINFGGWGLKIKTEDIARFGQLYLQKGIWNGRHILPEAWIEAATSMQVSNGDDPNSDWTQGYGYQFWRCRHHSYRADGAFGQYCVVMPDQDAVLTITGGVADMQEVLNVVWDILLPALGKKPSHGSAGEITSLSNFTKSLTITPPSGMTYTRNAEIFSHVRFIFEPNYETLRSLFFDFGKDECSLNYQLLGGGARRGMHKLVIGYGKWIEGISFLGGLTPQAVAASGVWAAEDTFVLTMCFYETPFILTFTCQFDGDKLRYGCQSNVAFGPLERPQLTGIAI